MKVSSRYEKLKPRHESIEQIIMARKEQNITQKSGSEKYSGGRVSSIAYLHKETKRILQFDEPHPGKELYIYQIK